MRRVVFQEFVSINGLAAGPNGNVDFIAALTRGDKSLGREQSALLDRVDTIVLGRVTYRMLAGYWPTATEGEEKSFADRLNAMSKIVFSRTLEKAPGEDGPMQGSSHVMFPTKPRSCDSNPARTCWSGAVSRSPSH
jgi:hypothetical protein